MNMTGCQHSLIKEGAKKPISGDAIDSIAHPSEHPTHLGKTHVRNSF